MRAVFAMLLLFTAATAMGSELVYVPVNPSFGGNPMNGTYLLNSAEAQNTFKDPAAVSAYSRDPLDNFKDNLTRSVLSQIANRIVTSAFGSGTGLTTGGHYQFGNYTIDVITADVSTITVSIADSATGRTTTIEVPAFAELSK